MFQPPQIRQKFDKSNYSSVEIEYKVLLVKKGFQSPSYGPQIDLGDEREMTYPSPVCRKR